MKNFDLSQYNWQTKILWWTLGVLSLPSLGFAVFGALSFSISQVAALGTALFISALVNQHKLRIPGTKTNLSVKEFFVFWGTIWLGLPGAVFLAAGAVLARFFVTEKDTKHFVFSVFSNINTAFVSSTVFYFILKLFAGFEGNILAENDINFLYVVVAVSASAAVHYIFNSLIYSLYLKFESEDSILKLGRENFAKITLVCVSVIATTLIIHFSFLHFGLAFGLVLLPLSIIGHLAYRIHIHSLEQKTKEISEASRIHMATVEALATAIDARDQVGMGHVRRTQIYAIGIGRNLGLSEDEINALRTGALLHDIGKLAVPDHILNKPGRLTPAEMEKTKIHAPVGAAILEKVGFSYPVVPTVKYHHESWDGTGYPEGLKGNEIPLTARILAVADAYDALRGARPYRAAVSREEARKLLLNGAGTQFDPKIVDVFLRNLRKFEIEVDAQGLSYIYDADDKGIGVLNLENSADQSYVEQIKRANREVFTLYELARIFSSSLNLYDTLSLFTKKISEFVPFDTCAIYLLDETQEQAVAVYAEGKNSKALKNKRVKIGEGATGYVLKKRQSVQNINPGLDFSFSQLEFAQEYASMAALPLITTEKLIGAVSLYSCELDTYEEEHLRLLETVSRIAADAIFKSLQHAETETRALTDPMTGLPNARSLQMQFEKEVARASRNGSSFQVLMLDLDGFKAVNDTYGHKAGDALLKGISKAMREQLRDYDFLSRYAGDEFVAIIPETDKNAIQELCQRLERAVKEFKLPINEVEFARVGVSLGVASYPQNGESFDQVVIAADKAMYAVKAIRKQKLQEPPPMPKPYTDQAHPVELFKLPPKVEKPLIHELTEHDLINESVEEHFIVEVDESHIISSAIN
ncbi:MAG: diguanylate cyclase [Pyrinomonadaceae bacterium]|nr:diguanylate cyclase [Pyrinomonadaceae bacterium]